VRCGERLRLDPFWPAGAAVGGIGQSMQGRVQGGRRRLRGAHYAMQPLDRFSGPPGSQSLPHLLDSNRH